MESLNEEMCKLDENFKRINKAYMGMATEYYKLRKLHKGKCKMCGDNLCKL